MDTSTTRWRKSSFSAGNNGDCIELAWPDSAGAVRDSKNPEGPHLRVPLGALFTAVKADALTR